MDHVICVIFYIYIGFYVPCLFPLYSSFRIHSFLSCQTFVEQMLGISDLHYIWFIKNDQFFKNDIAPSLRGKKSTRHTCSAQVYQDGDSDTLLLLLLSEFKYYWGHFEAPNWSWKRKQLAFSSTFVFAWAKHTHHVKPLTVRNLSLQNLVVFDLIVFTHEEYSLRITAYKVVPSLDLIENSVYLATTP